MRKFGVCRFEMAEMALSAVELGLPHALEQVEGKMLDITEGRAVHADRHEETSDLAALLATAGFCRHWIHRIAEGRRGIGSFNIERGDEETVILRMSEDDTLDLPALLTIGLAVALAWRKRTDNERGDPRITQAIGAAMYLGVSEAMLSLDDQLDPPPAPAI